MTTSNDTQTDDTQAVGTGEPYKERDDFVPDTTYLGPVDTTGTGGDLAAQVAQASPIFEQQRAAALINAAENPTDSNVILPGDNDVDRDGALANLKDAVEAIKESQPEDGAPYLSPAQQEAAMEGTPVNPNSPEALRDDTLPVDETSGKAVPTEPGTPALGYDGTGSDTALVPDEDKDPNPLQPNTDSTPVTPVVVGDSTPTTDTTGTEDTGTLPRVDAPVVVDEPAGKHTSTEDGASV